MVLEVLELPTKAIPGSFCKSDYISVIPTSAAKIQVKLGLSSAMRC